MEYEAWLTKAATALRNADITTPRLDAEILLGHVTGRSREYILAHNDTKVSDLQAGELNQLLARRLLHEPIAYIIERSEFYGRTFKVTRHTLVPRPETETMIELFLQANEKNPFRSVADVGTGSGAIAITLKLERPEMIVYGTDNSKKCIEIATENAVSLKAQVEFLEGDLFAPVSDQGIDCVVANLPYVPDSHTINDAAMHEPKTAIFGGSDGLDLYRQLFEQIAPSSVRLVLTESLPPQHAELAVIAKNKGFKSNESQDFIQIFERTI